MCSEGKGKFLLVVRFFSSGRVSAQVFSALLPLGNYKFKFNQPSGV